MGVPPLLRGNRFPEDWTHLPSRVAETQKRGKKGEEEITGCTNCPILGKLLTHTYLIGNHQSLHSTLLPTQIYRRYLFQSFYFG